VILIITFGVASLMRLVPGDPATLALGQAATDADREKFREANHLDESLPEQYIRWWGDVFQGNLGNSVVSRDNVTDELKQRFPSTLELLIFSMILTIIIGIPFGVLSAIRQNSVLDYFIRIGSIMGLSIPSFWLGLLMLLFFGLKLGWVPVVGYVSFSEDAFKAALYIVLPVATLTLIEIGILTRMARAAAIDVLRLEYVAHARAKGLRESRVLRRHVLPNAFAPTLTLIGIVLGNLLGGVAVIETVFTLPGLGRLLVDGIYARDYPVVQGCMLFSATIYVVVNLLVDLAYPFFDPRVTAS